MRGEKKLTGLMGQNIVNIVNKQGTDTYFKKNQLNKKLANKCCGYTQID